MKKAEIIEQLTIRKIAFDPKATVPELAALLPVEPVAAPAPTAPGQPLGAPVEQPTTPPAPSASDLDDIEVGDPQLLRPVELPLVVKPSNGGDWKNENQAEYAKILNGYAYKNPKKWGKKKAILLARLVEIGNDPEALAKYRADRDEATGNLSFKNKLIEA